MNVINYLRIMKNVLHKPNKIEFTRQGYLIEHKIIHAFRNSSNWSTQRKLYFKRRILIMNDNKNFKLIFFY